MITAKSKTTRTYLVDDYVTDTPLLSEALAKYLMSKSEIKDKTFARGVNHNVQYVTDLLGDIPIDAYTYTDATALRDKLIVVMMTMASVGFYTFAVTIA